MFLWNCPFLQRVPAFGNFRQIRHSSEGISMCDLRSVSKTRIINELYAPRYIVSHVKERRWSVSRRAGLHSASAICMTDDRALVHWRWTRCIVITHWPDTIKLSVMIVARPGARTTNARVAFIKLRQIIGTLEGSIIGAARSTAKDRSPFPRLPRETSTWW